MKRIMGLPGIGILIGLGGALAWGGALVLKDPWTWPFQGVIKFEFPSFATLDPQGNFYVIDRSLRRVSKVGPQGDLVYQVSGGSRNPGEIFMASELSCDDLGRLYVLNQVMEPRGFYVEREEILRLKPDGTLDQILSSRTYEKEEINHHHATRGRLQGLSRHGDHLFWYEMSGTGVLEYRYSLKTGQLNQSVVWREPNAALMLASVTRLSGIQVAWITKKGEIYVQAGSEEPQLVYAGDDSPGLSVPWWLGADDLGRLYFSDLTQGSIRRLLPGQAPETWLSQRQLLERNQDPFPYIYYTFSLTRDGRLVTVNDLGVVHLGPSGTLEGVLTEVKVPWFFWAARGGFWVGLGLLLLGLVLLVPWAVVRYRRFHQISLILKQLFILLPAVAGILFLVIFTLMNGFIAQYETLAFQQMSQGVQVISQQIDAKKLTGITKQRDFMNPDYQALRSQLHQALNYNRDPWNHRFYFALHRVISGKIYTFMYLNDGALTLHPFNYLNDPQNIYWKALNKEIVTAKIPDAWGSWILGVGPIKDASDRVVGILELGRDLYGFQQETFQAVWDLVLPVVAAALGLMLVFIGFTHGLLAPLKDLSTGAREILKGKWDQTWAPRGRDEIALLARGFHRMTLMIRSHQEDLESLVHGRRPGAGVTGLVLRFFGGGELGPSPASQGLGPSWEACLDLARPLIRLNQGVLGGLRNEGLWAWFPEGPETALQAAVALSQDLFDLNIRREAQGLEPLGLQMGIHGTGPRDGPGAGKPTDLGLFKDDLWALGAWNPILQAQILVTDEVYSQVAPLEKFLGRTLGRVREASGSLTWDLFEILEGALGPMKAKKLRTMEILAQGIASYQRFELPAARGYFEKVRELNPQDVPAQLYLQSCTEALAQGIPGSQWDGVLTVPSHSLVRQNSFKEASHESHDR